ncbi:hypothetical protein [Pseudomonas guariconensis]|jgi:hypothetical protein|uniref:hypothetical protein n=1 Tax=Pseudomonas guariconensis TaxID=1288410 RepID=UPI002D1E4E93|nr:hypothetical protein [Pseudomonas guariconensis]MEB3843420.1 hypothetical protein [Pseudomonas guariconensis]MEB3876288.1 hypothetical protein [Pseudomonas guariconensis]MEB3880875.1 hypothetical protein [Pseudomonas guariconensis]MEB3897479.1 hypothetical protein [Pseudomonas guariconensis]
MTTTTSDLGEKIMARLRVIEGFASILMENGSFKGDADSRFSPQLDHLSESVLHEAMYMLADQAQDQLLQLMNAAGDSQ